MSFKHSLAAFLIPLSLSGVVFADSGSIEVIKNSNIIKALKGADPEFDNFEFIDFGDSKYFYAKNKDSAFFISKDGVDVVPGNILRSDDGENVSSLYEVYGRYTFSTFISQVPPEYFISYGDGENVIYAFVDYTCPYCKKFHFDMDKINQAGYKVRLLPLSRMANNVTVIEGLMKIWCSDADRKELLKNAYRDKRTLEGVSSTCSREYFETSRMVSDFANDYGVRGTPAIFSLKGDYIGGYSGLEVLLERLGVESD